MQSAVAEEAEPKIRQCLFCNAVPPLDLKGQDMGGGQGHWYSNALRSIRTGEIARFYLCPNHLSRISEAWEWAEDGEGFKEEETEVVEENKLRGSIMDTVSNESETEAAEKPAEAEAGEYGLHIRLAREMQPALKEAAELAYAMGDIPKPDLGNLINLFIVWGLSIQKQKWLDRMGYR